MASGGELSQDSIWATEYHDNYGSMCGGCGADGRSSAPSGQDEMIDTTDPARSYPRLIRRDGSNAIVLKDSKRARGCFCSSLPVIFHSLISWELKYLMLLFFATYILFFILFGTLIFILDRTVEDNQMELNYWEGILFIGYTVSTVGYGTEFPKSGSAALAPLLAVLCGMLIHSFWVALLVCRLGDPRTVTHTVLFSNRAVVYDQPISLKGPQMFECRFVSLRTESWVEAHINMYYISWRSGSPEFIQLEMVNSGVPPLMSLPWSVKHEITPESPLYGLSIEQIATERGEVVVQVDGYCPFSGNGMTKRFSYIACEIFQGHVLYDVLSVDSNCQFVVCLDDFHRTKLQNNTTGDNS